MKQNDSYNGTNTIKITETTESTNPIGAQEYYSPNNTTAQNYSWLQNHMMDRQVKFKIHITSDNS